MSSRTSARQPGRSTRTTHGLTGGITLLAVSAALALVTAGCTSSPAQPGASAASSPAASTSSASTGASSATSTGGGADRREQGVKFAECVRANGVADFPDPDASGEFAYGVSVTPEVFTRAVQACKDLEPPGSLSLQRSPAEQSVSLEFARCVRENGVPDFPDPVQGEPLINTYKIPSTDRAGGMDILDAAVESCRALFDQAVSQQ